ncbi:uncharacterized protein LOC132564349 [Ylistrum balloti]|uniref:uncharacterized protein LOC132564349 n=1 Tax=Ylistrum balloti TaxID=509963 RepID=UPI002905EEAB|nr:uncharacterized protein LOC132564349 [Ylistrum balloti]
MAVHVFGNSPSPAVATFGLRKSVERADSDIKEFVSQNFYVDDGLVSTDDVKTGIDLMKRTQSTLAREGNLRLHKITSSSKEVLDAFHPNDLAKGLKGLELGKDVIPLQRSLGLVWNVNNDTFTYQVCPDVQPFTRRGVLSTVNSIFDPLGLIAPVVIRGKLILRDLMACNSSGGWDEPLPPDREAEWKTWRDSLASLEDVRIPRVYSTFAHTDVSRRELHTFADASQDAIAAASYLKTFHISGITEVSFVYGKAKVAPRKGHTIPRLELCAAVLAVEIAQTVIEQLGVKLDSVRFYSDSQVVLGYIHNEERRFYVYVSNRVEKIRAFSTPNQWTHVSTLSNPADVAARSVHAKVIQASPWVKGPGLLEEEIAEVT